MKKKNIRRMYLLALLQGMVFYAPVATLYRQAQGVSIAQITQIESLSLALSILLELPWGMLADRIGYKRTMVFCCWLYFASKLVFWQASGFGGFFAERVMLSVVSAGLSGVDTSILYLSCEGNQVQKVFGIYESLGTAGLLAASVLFSALLQSNYRLAALLGLLGRFSWQVTRKIGMPVSLLLFAGTVAASCLVLALTQSAVPAVLGILTLRLSNCLFQPLQLRIQNQEVRTDCRATALSIHAVLTDGVAILTNLLFGALAEIHLPSAFFFGAGISGLSILLLAIWLHGEKRPVR